MIIDFLVFSCLRDFVSLFPQTHLGQLGGENGGGQRYKLLKIKDLGKSGRDFREKCSATEREENAFFF